MKCQKGISMIELVIVLIIIILIASFSIYTGSATIEQANLTEVYTELLAIKTAVNDVNIKRGLQEDFDLDDYLGKLYDVKVGDMTEAEYENIAGIVVSSESFHNLQDSYIIYGMDCLDNYNDSEVRTYYGLDSIKHSYIVDFENSKVDLLKVIKIAGQKVKTFEQIRALVDQGGV